MAKKGYFRQFVEMADMKRVPDEYPRSKNSHADVLYIMKRFYSPFMMPLILLSVIAMILSYSQFFYTWCTRYATDNIVQINLADKPTRTIIDPSAMDESRRFEISDSNRNTSWSGRWDNFGGLLRSQKISRLIFLLVVACTWVGIDYLGNRVYGTIMARISRKVQYRMRHRIYDSLHALPMEYHDRQAVGSLMTNLFTDVQVIVDSVNILHHHSVFYLCSIIIGAFILLSIDTRLAMITFCSMPFYLITYKWFRSRLMVVYDNLRYQEGMLNAYVNNRIKNFYLVKSFVRELGEVRNFMGKTREIIHNSLGANVLGTLFTVACGIISGFCLVIILYMGTNAVFSGKITTGELLMFYTSAGLLFNPIAVLSSLVSQYHILATRCQKVHRLLNQPITLANVQNPIQIPAAMAELRFEDVVMHYGSARNPALDGISFTLPAGAKMCVMGSSGSGKTTLAKLSARIYDPVQGRILLDGHDIKEYRLQELRQYIGYVNQEPIIFDGTLKANIAYGSYGSQPQEIMTAARHAQIHDYITTLPERYETITAERGLTLSGGQKQRVNLARVLLADPQLLILDDCTSALDAETEARLIKEFDQVLKNRTAMIVSHRISMALQCDYVMLLKNGKILEFGEPEELLEQSGEFKRMMDEQIARSAMNLFKKEGAA
ncbi:MAG TPA: ABC transporter ATP-binding protein [Phycisphaerae bacterium]|nr:ABC transporter ATP-binding protein [Phycisphaerae bacterium]HPS53546.1 ABC transporter ATP-binding protein [Phycisphaerae bacterium]